MGKTTCDTICRKRMRYTPGRKRICMTIPKRAAQEVPTTDFTPQETSNSITRTAARMPTTFACQDNGYRFSFLLLFLLHQGREVDKLVLNPCDGNATAVGRGHRVKPPFGNPLAFLSNFGTTKSSSESAQKHGVTELAVTPCFYRYSLYFTLTRSILRTICSPKMKRKKAVPAACMAS